MSSITDWLRSLISDKNVEIHIKVNKNNNERRKAEVFENKEENCAKEVDIMTLTEKYWLTLLFVLLRYTSILMFLSGIGFILAGWLANPWWYLGLASWPLFIMIGVTNLVYICALTKHHRLQFRNIVNGY